MINIIMNNNINYYIIKYLSKTVAKYINKIIFFKDSLVILTSPKYILPLINFLKNNNNLQFKILIDLYGVDLINKRDRFQIVYNLLSVKYNTRIIVRTSIDEVTPITSISSIFNNAVWSERELSEMFGVYFNNHPNLTRLLTDYGFQGYPLRKDFPVIGYTQYRYDDEVKRVIIEPVSMSQEFRQFQFLSDWKQSDVLNIYN